MVHEPHGFVHLRHVLADGLRQTTDAETVALVDIFKLKGGVDVFDGRYPADAVPHISGRDFIINLLGELGVDEDSGALRVLGRGVWTDAALPADWTASADVTCVTDVRAEDEVARIRGLGGTMVEVVNPRGEFQGGRSEKGGLRLGFDSWLLGNERGLVELRAGVDFMMRTLADPGRVLERRAHG